jgi:predicted ester cyclase
MEQNKKTNRQVADAWQKVVDSKQFDNLVQVDATNFKMTNPFGAIEGVEGHKQFLTAFATAFPNYRHVITNSVEQGEWIAVEGRFIGDHTGPMMMGEGSVPATNKHVEFTYAGFLKIDQEGKVAEFNVYLDTKSFLNQLGLA